MVDGVARPSLRFLLRLWAEARGEVWEWRASLHDPRGPAVVGFPSPEAALAYLQAAMMAEQSRVEHAWLRLLIESDGLAEDAAREDVIGTIMPLP
jgi:hypothetical protein